MNVLIVEDEALLGLLLAETLTDAGHRVLGPADSPARALELVADCLPDLALVDIDLHGADSGIEVARDLTQKGVPCLFATGQSSKARGQRTLAIGLVAKPYSPLTIVEALRFLEAFRAGQRPARVPNGLEIFHPDTSPSGTHGRLMLAS